VYAWIVKMTYWKFMIHFPVYRTCYASFLAWGINKIFWLLRKQRDIFIHDPDAQIYFWKIKILNLMFYCAYQTLRMHKVGNSECFTNDSLQSFFQSCKNRMDEEKDTSTSRWTMSICCQNAILITLEDSQ